MLTTTKGWREILESCAKQLKVLYPPQSSEIDRAIEKYLQKSPAQDFLKAKAYQWLKYLEANPRPASTWFPHHAVEVAFKAFRLKGQLGNFMRFLGHRSRRQHLALILGNAFSSTPLPVEGLSEFVPSKRGPRPCLCVPSNLLFALTIFSLRIPPLPPPVLLLAPTCVFDSRTADSLSRSATVPVCVWKLVDGNLISRWMDAVFLCVRISAFVD